MAGPDSPPPIPLGGDPFNDWLAAEAVTPEAKARFSDHGSQVRRHDVGFAHRLDATDDPYVTVHETERPA